APIAVCCDLKVKTCQLRIFFKEVEFVIVKHVEFSFYSFTVGVKCRVEPTIRRKQFALCPFDGLLNDLAVMQIPMLLEGFTIQANELGIIIKHFLEMRDMPKGIY